MSGIHCCVKRGVAVAINVSPKLHSRTRTEVMRHFKVMFLIHSEQHYYAADHNIPNNWEYLYDFKGILKFQDLSEEDLSASCNHLKSKYSNWICLKT